MLAWSMITVKEYIALKYYGELAMYDITKSDTVTCRRDGGVEINNSILKAYRWMADKLREVDSNDFGLEFPRWFWFRYNAVEGRELFDELLADDGVCQSSMLCFFDLDASKVLLSDHTDWHCPLNDFYCAIEDELDEDWELKFTPSEADKIKSWDRIFDVNNKPFVQGVTWKLFYKDLIEAKFVKVR